MNTRLLSRMVARMALLPVISALILTGCGTEPAATTPTPGMAVSGTSRVTTATTLPDDSSGGSTPTIRSAALGTATNVTPAKDPTPDENYLSRIDACKLLTQADIEAAIGPVEYDPQPGSNAPYRRQCKYGIKRTTTPRELYDHLDLTLTQATDSGWTQWKDPLTAKAVSVTGVGDEAYADVTGLKMTFGVLVRGKALVQIMMFPEDVEAGKKLANQVIENLP